MVQRMADAADQSLAAVQMNLDDVDFDFDCMQLTSVCEEQLLLADCWGLACLRRLADLWT